MLKQAALGSALLLVTAVHSQTINLHGKVTDGTNKAVANANVELLHAKKQAITGADGTYSLTGPIALRRMSEPSSEEMALEGGALRLRLDQAAPVRIEIFDAKGNLLDRNAWDRTSAGSYRFPLAGRGHAGKLLIVKASIGQETKAFHYFPMAEGGARASLEIAAPAALSLAKMSAVLDTLRVTAVGYTTKQVEISSYDATVDVTLDAGGGGGDYWGGLKNPPGKSKGCGTATTVTSGTKSITSGGQARKYIIDIPANYDMNKPYKFFYCSHWIGAKAEDVVGQKYYWLKDQAQAAGEQAIFLAPQALPGSPTNSGGGTWSTNSNVDQVLFDDLLAYVKQNLCIDTTRVFATGFSFGGMMTYSLSTNHQHQIRAAVGIAPANYNIYVPKESDKPHLPMAWMQTTGMDDHTCPWINGTSTTQGSKYIAIEHAKDNGCTIPSDVPTWKSGAHVCYDFEGCKPGYPTKACTFNGPHTNIASDPGSNANWIPVDSWKFFSQF